MTLIRSFSPALGVAFVAAGIAASVLPASSVAYPVDEQRTRDTAGGMAADAADGLSRDGRLVVEVELNNHPRSWLEAAELDGSRRWRLTQPSRKRWDVDPVWSPDGSSVAFVRIDGGGIWGPDYSSPTSVMVVKADGTELREVMRSGARAGARIGGLVWSRDGQRLAFARWKCGPEKPSDVSLYTINADGSELRRLPVVAPYRLGRETIAVVPDEWSADGATLLYHVLRFGHGECRYTEQKSSDLYTIHADGTARIRLATGDLVTRASWSHDEASVVFNAYRKDGAGGDECSLFLLERGGAPRRLVDVEYVLFGCPGDNLSFSWSSDSRELAYSDGIKNIDAIDVTTGARRRVYTGPIPSPPCNQTGDVSDKSAPCAIRILARSPDGSRILVWQNPLDPYHKRLPLAIASFDGSLAVSVPLPTAGRRDAHVRNLAAYLP